MQMRLAWCCLGQCSSSAARFDLSDTPFLFFLVYKKASDLIAKTTPVYTNTVFPRQVWDYIYVLKSQAHLQKLQDRHGASASLTSSCRTKSSVPCPFPTSKPLRTKAALPHRSPAAPFGVEFTQDQSPALTLCPMPSSGWNTTLPSRCRFPPRGNGNRGEKNENLTLKNF